MTRARVVLSDDHELFREGVATLINAQSDMEVVGQAADGLAALTLAREQHPDLVVMDIRMPLCDGVEATRLIRGQLPDAKVLMLTVQDQDEKLFESIAAGASGYMLKNVSSTEFLDGLRRVLAGEAVLPPRLAARVLEEFARMARSAPVAVDGDSSELTAREREVLQWIATGATDKEIAGRLSLSLHTVKSHVRSILNKLHALNRREAARLAERHGWIGKPDSGARS
jgi:DNA-binding NarL/FixJ family response regulator